MIFDILNLDFYLKNFSSSYDVIKLLLFFIFFFPFASGIISKLTSFDRFRTVINLLFSFFTFLTSLALLLLHIAQSKHLLKQTLDNEVVVARLFNDVFIKFSFEPIGLYFAVLTSFLWFVTIIYSSGYLKALKIVNQKSFYGYFSFSMFAVMGISYSDNLISTFIFYELLTIFTFPLVSFYQTKETIRAGKIYLLYLLGTSFAFFLPAIIITYVATQTVNFEIGGIFPPEASPQLIILVLLLFVLGVGKNAIFPFHRWLPEAMVAPTPVSALLHAVAVVKSGAFILIKIFIYIFDASLFNLPWLNIITYLACFTIIFASIKACFSDNIKQVLAYSTIAQLSYILLALTLNNKVGNNAAILLLTSHAFAKISLFFISGIILIALNKKYISELEGVGKVLPITFFLFFINALSIIGLPFTGGMLAKYFLFLSIFNGVDYIVLATVIISTVLATYYLMRIFVAAFSNKNDDEVKNKNIILPKSIIVATFISSFFTLILFFLPWFL